MKRALLILSLALTCNAQYSPPAGAGGSGDVKGGSNLSISGCVAYQVSAATLTCVSGLTWDGSSLNVPGGIVASGGGTGKLTMAHGTTPSAPASGKLLTFFDSANSDHFSVENSSGAVTDLQAGGASPGLVGPLEAHTAANSAELDFTTCISSTYDDYLIELVDLLPASGANNLLMQVSTNGGSSYDTGTNYEWALTYVAPGTGPSNSHGSAATSVTLAGSNVANSTLGVDGTVKFYSPGGSSHNKGINYEASWFHDSLNTIITVRGGARYASNTAVNAFRLLMSSGNIASGTARCYGVSK